MTDFSRYGIPSYATVYTRTYDVRMGDAERSGLVSPASLADMFLDAAGRHADRLGLSVENLMEHDGCTWVLSRMTFEMERRPKSWDTVTVHTWPSGLVKLSALRNMVFVGPDGVMFGRATTMWFVIDMKTRRPVRIEPLLENRGIVFPSATPADFPEKLGLPENDAVTKRFAVRYADIDFNGHVTSSSYIRWVLENVPDETRTGSCLKGFSINYLAETLPGDMVSSAASFDSIDGITTCLHRISSESGGHELARAKSVWGPKPV